MDENQTQEPTQSGDRPRFPDFGIFLQCFGTANELCQHVEPIGEGRLVGFPDFGFFTANFSIVPGPSGPTDGTTACP